MLGTTRNAPRRVIFYAKRANVVVTTQIGFFQQPEVMFFIIILSLLQEIIFKNGINIIEVKPFDSERNNCPG